MSAPHADEPLCAECHEPLLEGEPTDKTGTMHFEPCAGEYRERMVDVAVDRAREREMWREWGGRT